MQLYAGETKDLISTTDRHFLVIISYSCQDLGKIDQEKYFEQDHGKILMSLAMIL